MSVNIQVSCIFFLGLLGFLTGIRLIKLYKIEGNVNLKPCIFLKKHETELSIVFVTFYNTSNVAKYEVYFTSFLLEHKMTKDVLIKL